MNFRIKFNLSDRRMLWKKALFVLLVDIFTVCYLVSLGGSERIYLRNILFSEIVIDSDLTSSNALDALISKNFKTERNAGDFGPFLNSDTTEKLLQLKNRSKDVDRDLAIAIVGYLGLNPSGQICGVPSLGKVVQDVANGIGCCSDFSKAWIFYANYLGMKVREVNTLGHNTVEYFDHHRNRWVWLDPYNRVEIYSQNNEALNQVQMRNETLFQNVKISKLPGSPLSFDAINYSGYAPRELSVLMWRKGTNFLTVEKWDDPLRSWGIPKELRQMFLLVLGVAPHWIMLTTNAIGAYIRLLQSLLYLLIGVLIFLNAYILVIIGTLLIKFNRENR